MRRKAIIALVFVVAAAVLVESWHAAMNAAETGGRPWPLLWPVTLEAFIFVLVLVYWDARSTDRKAPMARVLLAVVTGVASAVQILDAPPTWLGWLTAGWTPVALLLSVEFAVWLLYGAEPRPAWEPTPLGHPVPDPDQPDPEPDPDPDQPDPDQPPAHQPRYSTTLNLDQRAEALQRIRQGQSNVQITHEMGLSERQRKYRLPELVREVQGRKTKVSQNGDGPGGGS